jgi:hypothetical protein
LDDQFSAPKSQSKRALGDEYSAAKSLEEKVGKSWMTNFHGVYRTGESFQTESHVGSGIGETQVEGRFRARV